MAMGRPHLEVRVLVVMVAGKGGGHLGTLPCINDNGGAVSSRPNGSTPGVIIDDDWVKYGGIGPLMRRAGILVYGKELMWWVGVSSLMSCRRDGAVSWWLDDVKRCV